MRRLSPPGGNSRKKGLRPASPWWPGQAMFILKTHDQNHDILDSNKKRGRIMGQIWSVQHVSWMQRRAGVQSWFVRLMSFVQNQEKNLVIVLEKLFSYFFTFLEMIEKEKKVYHSSPWTILPPHWKIMWKYLWEITDIHVERLGRAGIRRLGVFKCGRWRQPVDQARLLHSLLEIVSLIHCLTVGVISRF